VVDVELVVLRVEGISASCFCLVQGGKEFSDRILNIHNAFVFQTDLKLDGSLQKLSRAALRCFERAVDIEDAYGKLWMEYGSLSYQLHAHSSRQLNLNQVRCVTYRHIAYKLYLYHGIFCYKSTMGPKKFCVTQKNIL
jgi:hypothetical protein